MKEVQTTTTFENVSFLHKTLNLFEPSHFCKKCSHCSSKSLVNNSESIFLIKAAFTKEHDAKVMLATPHEVLVKFCDIFWMLIGNDEENQTQLF